LSAAVEHDLKHGYTRWLGAERKRYGRREFSVAPLFVKQEFVPHKTFNVWRIT
jgi:hypothetical protein